jgi:hypothetical protein
LHVRLVRESLRGRLLGDKQAAGRRPRHQMHRAAIASPQKEYGRRQRTPGFFVEYNFLFRSFQCMQPMHGELHRERAPSTAIGEGSAHIAIDIARSTFITPGGMNGFRNP